MIFKDDKGRDWDLSISLGTARRLHREEVVSLIGDKDSFERLIYVLADPVAMLDVIWAIVKPEAVKREIDQSDFEEAIGTSSLADAIDCVRKSIENFIQGLDPNMHKVFAKGWEQILQMADKRTEHALKMIEDPEILEKMEQQSEKEIENVKRKLG